MKYKEPQAKSSYTLLQYSEMPRYMRAAAQMRTLRQPQGQHGLSAVLDAAR